MSSNHILGKFVSSTTNDLKMQVSTFCSDLCVDLCSDLCLDLRHHVQTSQITYMHTYMQGSSITLGGFTPTVLPRTEQVIDTLTRVSRQNFVQHMNSSKLPAHTDSFTLQVLASLTCTSVSLVGRDVAVLQLMAEQCFALLKVKHGLKFCGG